MMWPDVLRYRGGMVLMNMSRVDNDHLMPELSSCALQRSAIAAIAQPEAVCRSMVSLAMTCRELCTLSIVMVSELGG